MSDEFKPPSLKTYRVWINQVNQVWVEVKAHDKYQAAERGYAKWRRDEAHSTVAATEEQEK